MPSIIHRIDRITICRKRITKNKEKILPLGRLKAFYFRDWLNREDLSQRHDAIITAYKAKTENNEYPDDVHLLIIATMSDLEQICELIRMQYLERKDFLRSFSGQLFSLACALNNFIDRKDSKMPEIIARYPSSITLVRDILKETYRNDWATFDRLNKYIKKK